MLGGDGEIVCEESHVTSDDENATDSDEMEELSAEIQHSESSTTDEEDVDMLNSDDSVELSAEMEMKESSSSDVVDVVDVAIVDSGEVGELHTEVEPIESNMILDKEKVLIEGSDRSGQCWYFKIDLREKKLLAKSNKGFCYIVRRLFSGCFKRK
ncbi:uncharacterized protein [Parasteatoda tepidariorum]|uniref:uncharacterized protein isoform X1 n=1 Tax=Parasteatoda tepidariorum TaxID=114398 RepID=UPI001C723BA5|nr:uncharacterized protein LOC107449407 [Parasteatoda tepidariorum]